MTLIDGLEIAFWVSALLLAYVYFGYPILLLLISGMRSKYQQPVIGHHSNKPSVVLIISAFNEEAVIEQKLHNAVSLNYPPEKLEIVVVSDASNDRTDGIVSNFTDERVSLLRMAQRSGKSLGLNQAVAQSDSEIIVFTDANAIFESDALLKLVRHFGNPSVGVVTGQQRYYESGVTGEPTEEGLYWRYESWLKQLESRTGTLVGGDGAIMAIRRELFSDLDEDDLSDYILPMKISMQAYINVYESEAVCYEEQADTYNKEFKRKIRIVNRAWRATLKCRSVLNLFRFGALSLKVWSHKVLRWFCAPFMAIVMATNSLLFLENFFYLVSFTAQIVFYALALIGFCMRKGNPTSIFSIPYFFCSTNLAALIGIVQNTLGRSYVTWNTPRAT